MSVTYCPMRNGSRIAPKDVEMEGKLGNDLMEDTYDFNGEIEHSMEESDNESLEETDEENEQRP